MCLFIFTSDHVNLLKFSFFIFFFQMLIIWWHDVIVMMRFFLEVIWEERWIRQVDWWCTEIIIFVVVIFFLVLHCLSVLNEATTYHFNLFNFILIFAFEGINALLSTVIHFSRACSRHKLYIFPYLLFLGVLRCLFQELALFCFLDFSVWSVHTIASSRKLFVIINIKLNVSFFLVFLIWFDSFA